jgi:protein-L-isoaspartate(D-aspartate) O-methyltransferase
MSMDFKAARRHMIDSQLLPNRITDDAVVDAFAAVPRELFVPDAKRTIAYADEAVEVAPGRYLLEPMALARLVHECAPRRADVALIVGGATGYAAAILARLVSTVIMVEPDAALADAAARTLDQLEIDTVAVTTGACAEGSPKNAPFDVILVDGAVPEIPDALVGQLADGGRLGAILEGRGAGGLGSAVVLARHGGGTGMRTFADLGTPTLPGFERPAAFVF